MQTDRKIIDVDDEIRQDDRPEEIPVITIEETSSPSPRKDDGRIIFRETPRIRNRIKAFTIILGCILLAGIFFWAYRYYSMLTEVESSVSDAENIAILTYDGKPDYAVGSVASADSVLGVAFDMYSLSGLKASLEREMPDTADKSLVLFMRSADYHPDGSVLGEMVIDGTPALSKSGKKRQGYVAISKDGVPVVGISLSDKMMDFAKDNNGSFFRQYVLLGDGELPPAFDLHGKVERAAIARMVDGKLYYVVSRHKETMYDFADALREFGFTDAVYITGGKNYSFYRSPDGATRINDETLSKIEKYSTSPPPAPILVFRTALKK